MTRLFLGQLCSCAGECWRMVVSGWPSLMLMLCQFWCIAEQDVQHVPDRLTSCLTSASVRLTVPCQSAIWFRRQVCFASCLGFDLLTGTVMLIRVRDWRTEGGFCSRGVWGGINRSALEPGNCIPCLYCNCKHRTRPFWTPPPPPSLPFSIWSPRKTKTDSLLDICSSAPRT